MRTRPISPRRPAAAALLASVLAAAALSAEPPSDRSRAEAAITAVTKDEKHRELAAEPVARARDALSRSVQARAAGDHFHGAMLDALGLEWASAAEVLVRSAQLEHEADELQREVAEAETKMIRARALLEETVARRNRAQGQLEALQEQPAAPAGEEKP